MAKKAYSALERERIKRDLLVVGLKRFSQSGLRGVRLMDIINEVGISKPFFYTFYSSLEELVIRVLDYQKALLYQLARAELEREDISWEEKIYQFLNKVIYSRENHLLVMTQEEEVWVRKRLSPENFETFQKGQEEFYERMLDLWRIPKEKCSPKVLGNLILTAVLTRNSASRSLPFFFADCLEPTAEIQARNLAGYLAGLREKEGSRARVHALS